MGVAGGLLGALVPIAAGKIVDIAIPQAESSLAVAIALGLAIAAVSAMLFEVTRQYAVLRIQTKLDAGVQAAVWDRLLSLPVPFFRDYASGDLATRAMGINTISQMVTGATLSSLLSGAFSFFSIAVIFYYSVQLGLIATAMAVIIIGVTVAGGYVQLRYQRRETEIVGKVSSLVLQLLDGIAKLRIAGAEMRAFAIWAGQYSVQKAYAAKAQSASNALLVFNSAVGVLASLMVFAAVAFVLGGYRQHGRVCRVQHRLHAVPVRLRGHHDRLHDHLPGRSLLREGQADPAHLARSGHREARPWRADGPRRAQPRLVPLRPRRSARARRRLAARRARRVHRDRRPVGRRQVLAVPAAAGLRGVLESAPSTTTITTCPG